MELVKGVIIPKEKTYSIALHCDNCGKGSNHNIPWGTIAVEFNATCPNCGCTRQQVKEYIAKQQAGRIAYDMGPPRTI